MGRMGFPTVGTAMSIVNSGSNFDTSARDFEFAEAIWGKDMASIKGKTTKHATPTADISVKAKTVQKDQVLAIDIMFIDKIAILIGLTTPLGLTIAYSLNNLVLKKSSRSAEHVRKGIAHFLGVLGSQGFKTSMIMSDGEGAHSSRRTGKARGRRRCQRSGRPRRKNRTQDSNYQGKVTCTCIHFAFHIIECGCRYVCTVRSFQVKLRTVRGTGMGS